MRVLLDGHFLEEAGSGNSRYLSSLMAELVKQTNLSLFVAAKSKSPIKGNTRLHFLRTYSKSAINRYVLELPRLAHHNQIDIIHTTYFAPILSKCKNVITIHDIGPLKKPQLFSLKLRWLFKILIPFSMQRATAVIVPSRFSKRELLSLFPKMSQKISVTYEAPKSIFKPIEKTHVKKLIKRKFDITTPYILTINSQFAKKNIKNTVDAFIKAAETIKNIILVVVGKSPNLSTEQANFYPIKILGRINDSDLRLLYCGAEMFIDNSLYEGFSLPILEASACQIPVIASDIPVHHEIAGNSVLYADPNKPTSLTLQIKKLLNDRKLRQRMITRSSAMLKKFSWEKTAKETVAVYRKVLKQK